MRCQSEFREKLVDKGLFETNAREYVQNIRDIGEVVIWGTGSGAIMVYDFLKEYNVNHCIKCFADNSKAKWGTNLNGIKILSPDQIVEMNESSKSIYIIIASQYMEIKRQLLSLGISESNIDVKGIGIAKAYATYREETAYSIIEKNIDEYEKVYSYLADERSKEIYLGILNYKISLNNDYLKGIEDLTVNQYFAKDIVKLSETEVFCDCGSFNGDTLEIFKKITNGKYKKYIAIEADSNTYIELNENIKRNQLTNVDTYNMACWDKKDVLKFQSQLTAGHITSDGGVSINADSLDNVLKGEEITFIKMDIEGAEEKALIGAAEIIRKQKPILAICLYHDLEHFYKLPLIMKTLNDEYSLYVRHYMEMIDSETVCYAIPKNRIIERNPK
ncbi:MAG: FkbM family methyltransferase [Cellulosilyticum sp.]|nr:FkbM family methyltransferase [Cellulosilyticum sp.]